MVTEIHLNIYSTEDKLIGHKEKKYSGDNPAKNGYVWASNIFQNFATNVNRISVEIFEDGESVECNEYRGDTFLRNDLYCNIKRLINVFDLSDEVGGAGTVLTQIKHELKRYAKDKEYLEKK